MDQQPVRQCLLREKLWWGVPRKAAALIGGATILLAWQWGMPWFGIPFGVLSWALIAFLIRRDPLLLKIAHRLVINPGHHWRA